MSIISEVGHNIAVIFIGIFLGFLIVIGILALIFWFINTKVNIISITLKDIFIH